jgi:hypothetical protein
MPWTSGTAAGYIDLLDRVRRFAGGFATWTAPGFTGSGPGTMEGIDTYPTSPTETWTITCTDATTPGAEVWSVTGSVSLAQAAATTGVAYDNGIIKFTITGTGYAVNDQFTLAVTQGALSAANQAWTIHRWINPSDAPAERELIMEGPGLAGQDQVFVGSRTVSDVGGDWYNWRVAGMLGYFAAEPWDTQPGKSTDRGVLLSDGSMPYWIVASGRRVIVVARPGTVYQLCYLGLILPYALPGQYGLPLLVGGMSPSTNIRWSSTLSTHHNIVNPEQGAWLRTPGGQWQLLNNAVTTEINTAPVFAINTRAWSTDRLRRAPDGTRPLLPVVLHRASPARDLPGEVDGVFWATGDSATAEDIITINGQGYLLVPDAFRSGLSDYAALELA